MRIGLVFLVYLTAYEGLKLGRVVGGFLARLQARLKVRVGGRIAGARHEGDLLRQPGVQRARAHLADVHAQAPVYACMAADAVPQPKDAPTQPAGSSQYPPGPCKGVDGTF